MNKNLSTFSLLSLLLLSACATGPETKPSPAKLVLKQASFSDLPGWKTDRQQEALTAFRKSCARIAKLDASKSMAGGWAGIFGEWSAPCAALPPGDVTAEAARAYFENNFTPYAASDNGKADGLFTGYFEASLRGSSVRTAQYSIPLRARPSDLIMVDLGLFRDELKGQRIAGRAIDGNLKPYEDRAAIEDGKLPPAQDKPLLWVDSAADAFFLQIQGSGIVTMTDGTTRRVGYDGQNGHPYYAIGKELVKRGHLAKDDVSMQSIKTWLARNPVEGREIMRTNKSYVFFKLMDDGPKGGEGVTLTPRRSLAIDHSLIPYGVPVFVSTEMLDLKQLMVAQDTGGAIRGAVRGDVFFGYGAEAERLAGPMNSKGQYWFLLPKYTMPPDTK